MAKANVLGGVRYLTFAGGGGKGLVYLGVIKALEEAMHGKPRDRSWTRVNEPWAVPYTSATFPMEAFPDTPIIDLKQPINERPIIGISGASAGAITAFMLAMGMSSRKIFRTTEEIRLIPLGPNNDPVGVSPFETFFGKPAKTELRSIRANEVSVENTARDGRFLGTEGMVEAIAHAAYSWSSTFDVESIAVQRIFATRFGNTYGPGGLREFTDSLVSGFGLFTGLEVRPFFEELLAKNLLDGIDFGLWASMFGSIPKRASKVTFAMFMRLTGVDLAITGTNVTTKRPVVFSFGNTPDFPVTEAVGISMSIPLLFKPVLNRTRVIADWGSDDQYNVSYYGHFVDGGMLNNVPIHVFDYCTPQPFYHQFVKQVSPVAWSPERAQAEGWPEDRLASKSVSRDVYKALTFVFQDPKNTDLAELTLNSSQPAIAVYMGALLDTLLYSANAGQYLSAKRRAEVVEVDPNGIGTADFSNITLDAKRNPSPVGSKEPDRSRTKMMAIMNAYNTAWDRIGT